MRRKKKNSERLSWYLGELDLSVWEEAYLIDDAEKFRKLGEKKEPKGFWPRASVFRRGMAACLSILLLAGTISVLPKLSLTDPSEVYETDGEPIESDVLRETGPEETLTAVTEPIIIPSTETEPRVTDPSVGGESFIKSMDMFNYYSAVKLLFGNDGRRISSDVGQEDAHRLIAASVQSIDPNRVFYYTGVIFFQARLTDPNGFVARQIGTGLIDVVVIFYDDQTNSLGSMITFKNEDRYYSCIWNSESYRRGITTSHFSTHRYMKGFSVVKDFARTNYQYCVEWAEDGVLDIRCEIYSVKNGDAVCCDTFEIVQDSSVISDARGSITLAELEQYYNSLHDQHGSSDYRA